MKAKHKPTVVIIEEIGNENNIESVPVNETNMVCDKCEFTSPNNQKMELHMTEKHDPNCEIFDIKLEIFCLVEDGKDVHVTRQILIDKLKNQEEVETVDKVYVDKNESFIDVNSLQWNSVDIFLKSRKNLIFWKDLKLRRKIFSKCYLWETFEDYYGEKSRENIKRIKEEERASEMRSRGYVV